MGVLVFSIASGILALVFAAYAAKRVEIADSGPEKVREISGIIHGGAMTFLFREYKVLIPFVLVVTAVLAWKISLNTAISFISGAFCSALAGYVGMSIATRTNGKTAYAATQGVAPALRIAFLGGTVMGMSVVGLGILGVAVLYSIFGDPNIINGFGFGASSIALFARVGGGIYTKAADVGADLVGKVEAGIPEDDPRNPAVIADNVGDNVGDIAGMGADLFESYVNSIIAAMIVGAVVYGLKGVAYPLILAAVGILAAIIGTFFVRIRKDEDPQLALRRGTYVTGILIIVASFFITKFLFGNLR
ncbi:MAG: Putative K(+)-stimulated pyrophosphate-energized sodium pump, partial [bacterium 42_11]